MKDQMYGAAILVGSIAGLVLYAWLVYMFPLQTLQVTAFLAVSAVMVILAWIGWTMMTTPPLEPIDLPQTEYLSPDNAAAGERSEKPSD